MSFQGYCERLHLLCLLKTLKNEEKKFTKATKMETRVLNWSGKNGDMKAKDLKDKVREEEEEKVWRE